MFTYHAIFYLPSKRHKTTKDSSFECPYWLWWTLRRNTHCHTLLTPKGVFLYACFRTKLTTKEIRERYGYKNKGVFNTLLIPCDSEPKSISLNHSIKSAPLFVSLLLKTVCLIPCIQTLGIQQKRHYVQQATSSTWQPVYKGCYLTVISTVCLKQAAPDPCPSCLEYFSGMTMT